MKKLNDCNELMRRNAKLSDGLNIDLLAIGIDVCQYDHIILSDGMKINNAIVVKLKDKEYTAIELVNNTVLFWNLESNCKNKILATIEISDYTITQFSMLVMLYIHVMVG